MGTCDINFLCSFREKIFGAGDNRPSGVDEIIDDNDRFISNISDHVEHCRHVMGRSPLVHYSQGGMKPVRKFGGPLDSSYVWRDYCRILKILFFKIGCQKRYGGQMIHGHVEKSLNLAGMEIHGQHPICTGCAYQISQKFGSYGLPS
ncbi:MAG: hypothetical protein DDT18_01595 [Actinobacteria bacterium]|nr:hypothetical protein [Actinomycetota bacterium]